MEIGIGKEMYINMMRKEWIDTIENPRKHVPNSFYEGDEDEPKHGCARDASCAFPLRPEPVQRMRPYPAN